VKDSQVSIQEFVYLHRRFTLENAKFEKRGEKRKRRRWNCKSISKASLIMTTTKTATSATTVNQRAFLQCCVCVYATLFCGFLVVSTFTLIWNSLITQISLLHVRRHNNETVHELLCALQKLFPSYFPREL